MQQKYKSKQTFCCVLVSLKAEAPDLTPGLRNSLFTR
jgi:hypothetical protein